MKKRLYIFTAIAMIFVLCGCGKKAENETSDPTPTEVSESLTQAAATPVSVLTPTQISDDNEQNGKTTQEPMQEPSQSATPTDTATPDPVSVTPEPTKGGTEPDDKIPDSKDAETIRGYWKESFLVWLPVFETGSFEGFYSDETHDFIKLGNIKPDAVKEYIETLTVNGFDTNRTYTDKNGNQKDDAGKDSFCYYADNYDGWRVSLDYDKTGEKLVIGSGYEDVQSEDVYTKLRNETALAFLPEFTYGEYDSSGQDDDIQYVIFTAAEEDCRKYIGLIKEAGFTIDADEGDEDGILWYNASDAEGHLCEFIYSGGMVRIGCGTEN